MQFLCFALCVLNLLGTSAFCRSNSVVPPRHSNNKEVALGPAEFLPAVVVTTAVVFAVFNIENKIDLTDAGRAAARAKRKALKKQTNEVDKSNLDPYRWFADDDDEIDLFPPKKSGGGCG